MRVLIEVSASLGDLITDIAIMQTLAKGLDDCTIEVVTSDHIASGIEDCNFIHQRYVYSPGNVPRIFWVNVLALAEEWDIFLQLRQRGTLRWAKPWLRATVQRYWSDYANKRPAGSSMWEQRLGILAGIVPDYQDLVETRIPLLDGRCEHALQILGVDPNAKIMTVAPGAGLGLAMWPESHAVKVINDLKSEFNQVLILGRAVNSALCRRVATATDSIAIGGMLPLPYTMALLNHASFHIGTDNCLAQAAAANGTSTLAIGGPSNGYTLPWRQHQLCGNPERISVGEIIAKARIIFQ